ncbi:flagellar filament capping protein FliD [Cognaticolwellia aestuarii]|jgi:flagellar hook-associated protein 2|uniref:flagellar filament capping protein FliD n=1 Tax=Cognaticolwellia aestuarii TaxID=329993 RepID=UPI000984A788|nr:flagellar filament capping protein FliD [Cognaticolwellia aestuarii]
MNITSAGIGSGLDLESIITAFVTAESVPTEVRLQNKEDRITSELSGLGTFKSALSSFQSVVDKLKTVDDFNEQVINVGNDDISITTNGFASNGAFEISVIQLAEATRIQTPDFASASTTVAAGTLTFGAGSDSFDVAIDATDDLSTIRDKINAQTDNFGVTASLVNSDSGTYLSYTSNTTGTANELSVTTADSALDNLATNATTTRNAKDAIIEIDGAGNTVTSSSNEFKNTIEDVTIVANKVSTSGAATLNISQNTEIATDLVNEFVAAYNTLSDSLDVLSSPKFGKLAFDSDLRSMKGQLNDILTNSVTSMAGGNVQSLIDIGVGFNKLGKLEISTVGIGTLDSGVETLNKRVTNDLDELGQLFASSDGIVSQLTSLIDNYNDSDGALTKRQTDLSDDLSSISDEYDNLETRLRDYEDTLRKRFSFLDSTVAGYNATASFLTSALKSSSDD